MLPCRGGVLLLNLWLLVPCLAWRPSSPLRYRGPALRMMAGDGLFQSGDTVAVIGASGNVGRLAALRLADLGVKVRAVSRDGARARGFLSEVAPEVEVVTADTKDPASLRKVLEGVNGLIVCTGTTAFPTLAWRGGNTPDAIDNLGIKNTLAAWKEASEASGCDAKRVVLMSSIGVQRRDSFPFVILNAAGVLDAKSKGEDAVRKANQDGWLQSYCIVRPGQLIGGPYDNNYYLGTLAKLDRPARSVLSWDDDKGVPQGVAIAQGDTILGDTLRSTVAGVCVSSLLDITANADLAVINEAGPSPSDDELLSKLVAVCS